MKNNILITGGAGFIGSNFINYFIKQYKEYNIINFDSLTYASNISYLDSFANHKNYKFIKGDIRYKKELQKIFDDYDIKGVIHFAAESHVDNSINNPAVFIETNVLGTFNLLDCSYRKWMNSPNNVKSDYKNSRFHHISTDEVYGSLGDSGFFTEKTPYAPNSPYSASKASSDMIVRSYYKTYGLNMTISNCSNNYGPNQNKEKLIPTIINNIVNENPIPIYGNGDNVRDWLYVLDHCTAIDSIFHNGKKGNIYNIGGNEEKSNLEIVNYICSFFDKKLPKSFSYSDLITFVQDRPGHDFRYAIDSTKILNGLNWKPKESFKSGIEKTIEWYLNNEIFK